MCLTHNTLVEGGKYNFCTKSIIAILVAKLLENVYVFAEALNRAQS